MANKYDFKVLVAEKLCEEGVGKLGDLFDTDCLVNLSREELLGRIGEYDALVVRSGTQVDSEVIARGERLKVIGRAGIGVDNIDLNAATKRGVLVANVPESNIVSAAEHTMAMLMSLTRRIPAANASLKGGSWDRGSFQGVELNGKTLGIIGIGRIGALVAERAASFGMKLIGYDPFVTPERAAQLGITMFETVEDVVGKADFVTLHVPRTKDTIKLLSTPQFDKAKKGLRIVNVSRGGIVDEEALAQAIIDGKVAGAAIDVFENEPPVGCPLLALDEVVVTPHLGASTSEAQYKAGVAIADQVIAGLTGGFVSGAVNISMPHKEVVETLRPYMPLCEKLGTFFANLMTTPISEINIEIFGEISEYDTSLLTVAFLKGLLDYISMDPVTYVNAPILAKERGIEITESKSRQSRDYINLVMVTVSDGTNGISAGATIIGKSQEIFVRIFDYDIDVVPSSNMAFVTFEDRPGMIGQIGTVVGKHNINIAGLQVGKTPIDGKAAMALNLDSPLLPEIVEELIAEPGIISARYIEI